MATEKIAKSCHDINNQLSIMVYISEQQTPKNKEMMNKAIGKIKQSMDDILSALKKN